MSTFKICCLAINNDAIMIVMHGPATSLDQLTTVTWLCTPLPLPYLID